MVHACQVLVSPLAMGLAAGHGLHDRRRSHDFGSGLADFLDRIGIHVIAVNVGDQDEVCLWKSRELHGLGGIEVDGLSSGFDQRAGVVQRRDLDRTR